VIKIKTVGREGPIITIKNGGTIERLLGEVILKQELGLNKIESAMSKIFNRNDSKKSSDKKEFFIELNVDE
jgi:hypothetical protein